MELELSWLKPIPLKDARRDGLIYTVDWSKFPRSPGLYVFGRSFGSSFEALYVGKAGRLQGRIKGQLNNLRLMRHLQNARIGKRIVLVGEFQAKPGQQQAACLKNLERAFIRHYLSEGHDLVNIQGTSLRQHKISSNGKHPKRWWPRDIYLEK